jgi:hypothetical protein
MLLMTEYSGVRLYKTDKSASQLKAVGAPFYQLDDVRLNYYSYKKCILTEEYKATCIGALIPPQNAVIDPGATSIQWVALPDNSYKLVINYFVKSGSKAPKHLLSSYYEYALYCLPSE